MPDLHVKCCDGECYVKLTDEKIVKSVALGGSWGVVVDLDANDRVVGVEFLSRIKVDETT